jgi:hypothetical protein
MDREYNRRNRNFGLWTGAVSLVIYYVLITVGRTVGWDSGLASAAVVLGIASTGLFMTACYCWAKYKNQSGWHALWGLLAPIGLIPLAVMKDETTS